MSDFCKQCSLELFGQDFRDLANLLTEEQEHQGLLANVICERCGFIQVNSAGQCLTHTAEEHSRVGCWPTTESSKT